jgi:hypothetical protein
VTRLYLDGEASSHHEFWNPMIPEGRWSPAFLGKDSLLSHTSKLLLVSWGLHLVHHL